MPDKTTLRRTINLPFLIFYGVGTMVGGGIYALLGEVAGQAGMATPIAMALSGLLALLSGLSFAELSSRFPLSAGEAHYVQQGFAIPQLSTLIGWLVIATGIVSAATLSVATVGFFQFFYAVPDWVGIVVCVLLLGAVAGWGIGQSVLTVSLITFIEVAALIYAIGANADAFADLPRRGHEMLPHFGSLQFSGIFAGAFLAFYAFIGFEDMVNMAEEVKTPSRTLPTAIIASLLITLVFYMLVSIVAVLSVSPGELAKSNTPLATLVSGKGWYATTGIGIVSLLTGVNGALVQMIMSSRVAYGMAQQGQAPVWLGKVNAITRTPLTATIIMTVIVIVLALFFPLRMLAEATSTIILVIFATVNLALWRVKGSDPDPDGEGPRLPRWLPMMAFVVTFLALLYRLPWASLLVLI